MPQIARVNDLFSGVCCCGHEGCISMTGRIYQGNENHQAEGKGVARLNDLVIGDCGHMGYIASGSSKMSSGGINVAYLGSAVNGCLIGFIITGAANHTVGI